MCKQKTYRTEVTIGDKQFTVASILDAHEITPNAEKALILLTFPWWHLFRTYNTKMNGHPAGVRSFLDVKSESLEIQHQNRRFW